MNYETAQTTNERDDLTFQNEPCKPLSRSEGEAPFRDSWEAEAYALGNLLVKLKHVTAKEWMDLMAESIQEAQSFGDPDTGETYYQHWCRSLEKFCFMAGLTEPEEHRKTLELWKRAIHNTPHGVPLVLENAFHSPEHPAGLPIHAHQNEHSHPPSTETECTTHSHAHTHSHVHTHSHDRPPTPPETYYAPIAKQTLKFRSL